MKIGYVRVSMKDQPVERQLQKMRELGIEDRFIFVDHGWSGKDFDRPEYQAMKRIVRPGDVIYLDALDRLGRDYDGIIKEWKEITCDLGADIVVLENASLFDSRKFREMGDIGKLMEDQFLALLAYVAEQERKKMKQRQQEGIAVAKAKGVRFGRPGCQVPPNFREICQEWKEGKITAVEAMRRAGMKKTSFYKAAKELTWG
ncbi:site-specific recombinases [Pelotomaculum thermopropionicum SI]|uniref:Site-specific recombinases n=1 Tax=Pelotomaculum thermopropionicum (strain DSM 13744 / JCM 10971 / SI) TaxID=370438 RepID=A5CZG3_PELTS|nr:site-specific recombinases [Pelotomaculum thermopropionicum SI]